MRPDDGRRRFGASSIYFGPWDDPDTAVKKYLEEKDDLHAGQEPRRDQDAVTMKDVSNAFLNAKKESVKSGELSNRTWDDYKAVPDLTVIMHSITLIDISNELGPTHGVSKSASK